jgi:hypothetical protein
MRRVLVLAPCALALSACGGGGSKSTTTSAAANPLAAAVTKTQQAGSEDMTLAAKVTLNGGQEFTLDGKGVYDQQSERGDLNGKLGLASSGTTPVEELFDHTNVYLRSAVIAGLAGSGKPWLKIDLAKSGSLFGVDLNALAGETPGDALARLASATAVETVGDETVDGTSTTHYQATIAASPVDVWVDDQGLIRKVHLDYTTKSAKSSGAHIVVDMSLSNFGVDVKATPPPASQVSALQP